MSANPIIQLNRGTYLTDEKKLYEVNRVLKDGAALVNDVATGEAFVFVPSEFKELRVVESKEE